MLYKIKQYIRKLRDQTVVQGILKFLYAFAKFRKATIAFVISVRPSVRTYFRMEQLASFWTDFHTIRYLSIFQ